MTAQMEYQKYKSEGWKLSNPFDSEAVYDDVLGWHQGLLEKAIAWFVEEHGWQPTFPIRPSCVTGDWSDSAVALAHQEKEVETVKEMLEKMMFNPAMKYQWGGLGYLLYGEAKAWEDIPQWAADYLKTRVE